MPRGTTLAALRNMVKGEVGFNQTTGTAADKEINTILADKQQWLASEYDWPFLRDYVDIYPANMQRYILMPGINYERPFKSEVKYSALWQPVEFGISSIEYNYLDSDIGNGQDPIMRIDWAAQFEVMPPATAPTLAAGGAGNPNGAYLYAVTYVTADGESLPGPTSTITVAAHQVSLTAIPIGPSENVEGVPFILVTARKVYRTIAGGTQLLLLTTLNDNTTTTFTDNVLDASLAVAAPAVPPSLVDVFEIWPLPVTTQQLRIWGQRTLNPLVADTDQADLDDIMLMLLVSAEWLTRKKQADAGLKLKLFQDRMAYIRSSYPRRTRQVVFGSGGADNVYNKIVPARIVVTAGGSH